MKKKMLLIELITGMIILLGGLMTYGLGIHNILPVPRPDLIVWGTTLVGIILIVSGSDLLSKKTKAEEIEENDERNIAIGNAAMALGFKVMTTLFVLVLFALIFAGYMNEVSCFGMIAVFMISQVVTVFYTRYLDKTM